MEEQTQYYVAGMGLVTAIGPQVPLSCAAVKAGVSGFAASPYNNRDHQPITMARVPDVMFEDDSFEIDEGDHYNEQQDRVIKMAVMALREACTGQHFKTPVPVVLAMPEAAAQDDFISPSKLLRNLSANGPRLVDSRLCRTIHSGRAAGIEALDFAYRYLHDSENEYCLIGGSDSHGHYSRLQALDADDRLMTAAGNSNGFVAGEAGSMLLLTSNPKKALVRQNSVIALHPPGLSFEAGHYYSEEPYRGDGLDRAFKNALRRSPNQPIETIHSSMNGEHYWAREYGVASLRNQSFLHDSYKVEHPADCWGDLGAATATALITYAIHDLYQQPGPGNHLVYSSSDYGQRGAVLLERIMLDNGKEA